MFKKTSRAGWGMYSTLLFTVLNIFNLDVTQSQVDELVIALGTIISFIVWVWGQTDRGDLTYGLFRK